MKEFIVYYHNNGDSYSLEMSREQAEKELKSSGYDYKIDVKKANKAIIQKRLEELYQ